MIEAYHRACEGLAAVLAVALVLLAVTWALGVARWLKVLVYTEQFLAGMLALSLALVFLEIRLDRRRGGPAPVPDLVLAGLGLGCGGWVAAVYPALSEQLAYDPQAGFWLAAVLLALIVEALRRVAGWPLTVILLGFLAYGLFGDRVPGRFAALTVAPARLVTQITLDTNGILGTPLLIASTIVVIFVLFGTLLNRSGGGRFFNDLALALMGRYRGGAAKIAILASSLFGAISGSAVSNVATTGIVTIPLMRRAGFKPETAAGIEAVASTGGQLMPPVMGASAFLMAEFLEIPYSEVIVAALLPALLYYLSLFLQADLGAARAGIAAVDAAEIPPIGPTLRDGWGLVLPFAALIGGLFWLNYEPDLAGLAAIAALLAYAFVIGHGGRRLTPGAALAATRVAGLAAVDIIIITAAAGVIIGVLNETGLSFGLTLFLTALAGKSLVALLLVAALVSIVLGMGMPTIGVYVLLAALVVPALTELGIRPIAAHLFVLYFGMMSMITPPVAIAAFAAASLGRASPMGTALSAMRFGWPAYVVPFIFVATPELILIGRPVAVLVTLAAAVAGVACVSAALAGYARAPLKLAPRAALVAAGAALLAPLGLGPAGLALKAAGLGLALLVVKVSRPG